MLLKPCGEKPARPAAAATAGAVIEAGCSHSAAATLCAMFQGLCGASSFKRASPADEVALNNSSSLCCEVPTHQAMPESSRCPSSPIHACERSRTAAGKAPPDCRAVPEVYAVAVSSLQSNVLHTKAACYGMNASVHASLEHVPGHPFQQPEAWRARKSAATAQHRADGDLRKPMPCWQATLRWILPF